MPYVPGANTPGGAPGGDFVGTGGNVNTLIGADLGADLSVIPILLNRGKGTQPTALSGAPGTGELSPEEQAYTPAELKTATQVSASLYQMPPDKIAALQDQLYAGGFYKKAAPQIVRGQADDDTAAAWNDLIGLTARAAQKRTLSEVLDEAVAAGGGLKPGVAGSAAAKAGRAPFSPTVTNPDDIRDVAQKTAKTVLGRGFSDAELARFVGAYQQMETGAQAQDYQATAAGGTTVQAPTMQAAAEAQARQQAPVEAGAHDLANVFDMFSQIIGGAR